MKKKEINKTKKTPSVNKNVGFNTIKNKNSKCEHKKKEIKKNIINKKKTRSRSISAVTKVVPKNEQIKKQNSFKNSLELDYLNFSKIDLFKLDRSFEDDIFTPNYNLNNIKNNKKKILNRYEDSNSTINNNSSIININNKDFDNIENINQKEYITNTPSAICNYYDKSSNKKKSSNKMENSKFNNDDIKKNLKDYYNINNNSNNKIIENEKNLIKNEKNIIKENKDTYNKINNYSREEIKNNIINNNGFSKKNIIIKQFNNKNKKNIYNDGIKTIDYNLLENKINVNIINDKIKVRKGSHPKPFNIYYMQNIQTKNEGYYITPRNINKVNNEKNLSSTKSTKLKTNSIGKAKSFSSHKINKPKYINNNLIYLNNNKINKNTNYKIIKELIKDNKGIKNNKSYINKTTPKYKNSNIDIKKNLNNLIKVNLKNKTKSSSNLNILKKQILSNENQILNQLNNKKNNNNKINSEIKNSFTIFQNIYKTINKSGIKSPDKGENNQLFKTSKTLTEQNIIHKIEATPKNYKIQKFDSIPFTTIVKKIFIGSSQKDNLIKFDSSMKKNEKTKTEQMKIIFKPKTQSDFKPYNNLLGNELFKKSNNNGMNLDYGNDKHVKQKLLDRMNKATNNWNYIFKSNKNKKMLDDGISNLKSQNKEHCNYFYKNDGIISDGSEKEDEDNL